MSSIEFAYTYPRELEKAKAEQWPILLPVGTMEYHSAHCPFGCDTLTAMGLVREIAKKIETNMDYPGQIKVNLIRENRAVDYAK